MKISKYLKLGLTAALSLSLYLPVTASAAMSAAEKEAVSQEITTLYRAARGVISANQKQINDPNVGDKGLTGDKVIANTKEGFKKTSGSEFKMADEASVLGQAQRAMFKAIDKVMSDSQSLINEKGKGFKGFLPAIFARLVATEFNTKMDGKMSIKLTAPATLVRNRKNRPDEWEANIIDNKFMSATYEKGKAFAEESTHDGKSAYRSILPEYYGDSCLGCHGEPKGETDITGGKKEGGKLGDLGGAISLVIYN